MTVDEVKVGQRVIVRDDSNGGSVRPGTVLKVAEPWTTGTVPIKVRLRGGAAVWTVASCLELNGSPTLAPTAPDREGLEGAETPTAAAELARSVPSVTAQTEEPTDA